jgi:hypothetical protein
MGSPDYPGREVLGSGKPRVVLARLMDGDPLEIGPRCQERLQTECWLVDLSRLVLRAYARIAYAAPRYRGRPPLDDWLRSRIDQSVVELVREDREEERTGIPAEEPWDPRYAWVSETLGLEPELARRACIAFNDLPRDVRQTYFAISVEQKSLNRWIAEGNGPPDQVREKLERAFRALSPRPGPPPEELQ